MQPSPNEEIVVRAATPEDLDFLVEGNRALAEETEGLHLDVQRLRAGVEGLLTEPARGRYWIAERRSGDLGSERVGQTMITFEWSDWRDGNFWWIQSVYVKREARRTGVFRALFDEVVRHARDAGNVCGLRLYVDRHNDTAAATYRSLGMEESDYRLYEVDFVLSR